MVSDEEFYRLEERVRELEAFEQTHLTLGMLYHEPARPREGMIAYADGTSWNPGGCGIGLYQFRKGQWYRLATDWGGAG